MNTEKCKYFGLKKLEIILSFLCKNLDLWHGTKDENLHLRLLTWYFIFWWKYALLHTSESDTEITAKEKPSKSIQPHPGWTCSLSVLWKETYFIIEKTKKKIFILCKNQIRKTWYPLIQIKAVNHLQKVSPAGTVYVLMTHLPSCLASLIIPYLDPFYCWTVVRLTSKYWRSEIEKMFRLRARLKLFGYYHDSQRIAVVSKPAEYLQDHCSRMVFCLQMSGYSQTRLGIRRITSLSKLCDLRDGLGYIYVAQGQIASIWNGKAFVQATIDHVEANKTIWNVTISVKDWKTLFCPSCEICFNKAFGFDFDPLQLCLWCKHTITDDKWCNDLCKEEAEYYAIPVEYRMYKKADLKKYLDSQQ